jgi:hypothetical protein
LCYTLTNLTEFPSLALGSLAVRRIHGIVGKNTSYRRFSLILMELNCC